MTPAEFKAIRVGLGLSQANIAAVVGRDTRTVQRWEGGVTPIPVLVAEKVEGLRDEARNA